MFVKSCCKLGRWAWRTALGTAGFAMVFAATAVPAFAFLGTPEIDPGSMGSALTLLTGGVLLLTARLRK